MSQLLWEPGATFIHCINLVVATLDKSNLMVCPVAGDCFALWH